MVDLRRPNYDSPRVLRHVDFLLPVLMLAMAAIGVLMVYSATRGPATDLRPAETFFLGRQARMVGLGAGAMALAAWFGHRRLQRMLWVIHGATLVVLTAVQHPPRRLFPPLDTTLQPTRNTPLMLLILNKRCS